MQTFILPTKEQFERVMTMEYEGPIFMINLLKFEPDEAGINIADWHRSAKFELKTAFKPFPGLALFPL